MLSHFSASNQAPVRENVLFPTCQQQACRQWTEAVETHMQEVLVQAEDSFTAFLLHERNQIICPHNYERVVDEVDILGLKWSEFAYAVRGGSIIEWYDTTILPTLLQPLHTKQHRSTDPTTYMITVKQGHMRPKAVPDMAARAEYQGHPCRYQMTLHCDAGTAQHPIPLIVECQYNDQPTANKDWLLQITRVYDPRVEAEKWNADYTQRLCVCAESERIVPYAYTAHVVPTRRFA